MTEETGRSLFPERSIYEHQLERPQFSGLRRQKQSPFGKQPPRPKRSTRPSARPEPHPHNLAVTLIFAAVYFYISAAAHQFAGGGVLFLHAAVLRCTAAAPMLTSGLQGSGAKELLAS